MTKIGMVMSVVALGALTLGGRAGAAPGPVIPLVGAPSGLSAGVFIPSDGSTKDKGGSSELAINFQYGLPLIGSLGPLSHTVIGLGVETGSKGGSHSTVIPLTISQMFGANNASPTAAGNFYYGGGVGLYFLNQSSVSVATRIGAQLEAGYNVTSALYADAKYQFVDHANGFVVSVGGRF